jgi:hypothetical protein
MADQTWSPSHAAPITSFSSGNLTISSTTTNYAPAYGAVSKTSGKWYWEVLISNVSSTDHVGAGIGQTTSSASSGQWIGIATDNAGISRDLGVIWQWE